MESNDEDFGVNPKWACRMANRELASTVESGLSMVFPSLEFGKKKKWMMKKNSMEERKLKRGGKEYKYANGLRHTHRGNGKRHSIRLHLLMSAGYIYIWLSYSYPPQLLFCQFRFI